MEPNATFQYPYAETLRRLTFPVVDIWIWLLRFQTPVMSSKKFRKVFIETGTENLSLTSAAILLCGHALQRPVTGTMRPNRLPYSFIRQGVVNNAIVVPKGHLSFYLFVSR